MIKTYASIIYFVIYDNNFFNLYLIKKKKTF